MARPWTVQRHREFGSAAQRCVVTVLLCNRRLDGGVPRLPIEVWLLILERLRGWNMGQSALTLAAGPNDGRGSKGGLVNTAAARAAPAAGRRGGGGSGPRGA